MVMSRNNVGIFYFINQEERLIMETKLFEILVYNRSVEAFNKYWNNKVGIYRRDESDEEWVKKAYIYKSCSGRCARWMNSIIGYIHVYQSGIDLITTLSIDYREKKYLEGAPDIHYDPSTFTRTRTNKNMTSQEILNQFNADLIEGCNERLKGRYIDLEAWNNTAKFIDWHELFYPKEEEIEEENKSEEEKIREKYKLLFGTGIPVPHKADF